MRLANGDVLLHWPLARHELTAGMYYWNSTTHKNDLWHGAVDMRCTWDGTTEQPIMAAEDGVVSWTQDWDGHTARADSSQSYGNAVRIKHADYKGRELLTHYAHMSRRTVNVGDQVSEGQVIGYTGATGNASGAHLHFEVRWAGDRRNPLCWLDDDFVSASGFDHVYTYGPGEGPVMIPEEAPKVWGHGIDTSKHQWEGKQPIDFKAVRAADKRFVIARAGYGMYDHQKDPYFDRTVSEAAEAGLLVGAYWYSYAVTPEEAKREAAIFANVVEDKHLDMGCWFDQEYEPEILALTTTERTEIVKAFVAEFKRLTGRSCGLYCSQDWINNKLHANKLTGTELWVAAYTGGSIPRHVDMPYVIWQTDGGKTGRCPGVDGPCDLDVCYKDYSEDSAFHPLSWHRLVCFEGEHPACEIFASPDVNDVLGVLPEGQVLQVIAVGGTEKVGGMTGTWYQVNHNAYPVPVFVLALSDRCEVVDDPACEPDAEIQRENIRLRGIIEDVREAVGGVE